MMQTDRKATAQNQQVLIAPKRFHTRVPAHMSDDWPNRIKRESDPTAPILPKVKASSLTRWNSGSTGTNLSFGAFGK